MRRILKYMKDVKDNGVKGSIHECWNDLFHYFCDRMKILSFNGKMISSFDEKAWRWSLLFYGV